MRDGVHSKLPRPLNHELRPRASLVNEWASVVDDADAGGGYVFFTAMFSSGLVGVAQRPDQRSPTPLSLLNVNLSASISAFMRLIYGTKRAQHQGIWSTGSEQGAQRTIGVVGDHDDISWMRDTKMYKEITQSTDKQEHVMLVTVFAELKKHSDQQPTYKVVRLFL